MTRLWFIVPVHGREALTKVCLRQLARTCEGVKEYGIDATAVVIGEGPILEYARKFGFGTISRDNEFLGRRFNDGYQGACDPDHNPEPADYVVPCGSDDWVDPVIFRALPAPDTIGIFEQMAVVNEDRSLLSRLQVRYTGGAGIRVIPRELIAQAGYRPAAEDRERAIDTSTLMGLKTAIGRMPKMVTLDVHPLQIVDWKTQGEQLNPYGKLGGLRCTDESSDPYGELAAHYPTEALEEMRNLERELVPA